MMKLYRQGCDYSEIVKILAPKAETWSYEKFSIQSSWSARTVNGSVLVRYQNTIITSLGEERCFPGFAHLDTCPHTQYLLSEENIGQNGNLSIDRDLALYWQGRQRDEAYKGTIGCDHDHTDFHVQFNDLEEWDCVLIITRWLNLGKGESPADPKWLFHVRGFYNRNEDEVYSEAASTGAVFESKECVELASDSVSTAWEWRKLFVRGSRTGEFGRKSMSQ